MAVEVTNARICSSETNKLRYVHSISGTPRDIAIKEQEINYIEIEIVPFIINFRGNCTLDMDEFNFENGASVSEELVVFNGSSAVYILPFVQNEHYQYLINHQGSWKWN